MSITTVTANKTTEPETLIQSVPQPETASKYKSWAEMAFEDEERQIMQEIMEERRYLYSIGEYELEEGEILE